jgi:hypothetical protein
MTIKEMKTKLRAIEKTKTEVDYDGTMCDGYCLAADCEVAWNDIDTAIRVAEGRY